MRVSNLWIMLFSITALFARPVWSDGVPFDNPLPMPSLFTDATGYLRGGNKIVLVPARIQIAPEDVSIVTSRAGSTLTISLTVSYFIPDDGNKSMEQIKAVYPDHTVSLAPVKSPSLTVTVLGSRKRISGFRVKNYNHKADIWVSIDLTPDQEDIFLSELADGKVLGIVSLETEVDGTTVFQTGDSTVTESVTRRWVLTSPILGSCSSHPAGYLLSNLERLGCRKYKKLSAKEVRELQEKLLQRGFSPGPIDGVIGPLTRASVGEFQRLEGLPETGYFDKATKFGLALSQ